MTLTLAERLAHPSMQNGPHDTLLAIRQAREVFRPHAESFPPIAQSLDCGPSAIFSRPGWDDYYRSELRFAEQLLRRVIEHKIGHDSREGLIMRVKLRDMLTAIEQAHGRLLEYRDAGIHPHPLSVPKLPDWAQMKGQLLSDHPLHNSADGDELS